MTALVISVSSDSSNESVGSSIPRVILFGSIPDVILVVPEIPSEVPIAPESGPSEGSLPPVPVAPMVLPLLYSNDSELNIELPERHVSSLPHDAMIARWRSITGQDIPVGRLYRTHLGEPCRALTVRKSVGPLLSHHHSSSGHYTLDHSSSGHTPLVTTIADSSTPSRFVYLQLARTSWYSEAYRYWRFVPLSTMHLLIKSESSAGDSSSESSVGPSRKRCRSPTATMTLHIPTPKALVPARADLLPPRKRFRDSILPKDSVEDDIDADVLADIESDAIAIEAAATMDVKDEIDVGIGFDVRVDKEYEAESSVRGIVKIEMDRVIKPVVADDIAKAASEDYPDLVSTDGSREVMQLGLDVSMQELYNHMHEIPIDRITDDGDNGNSKGNGDGNGRGNGNENGVGNGNGNPNRNDRGVMSVARKCTYHDFVKCQQLNFKGTEGVVRLTRWFEKMETIFHISNCLERELMKLMTKVYCPRNEIQKMATKLWNLIMKGNDLAAYT
ncbi:hypothetical protein Tco_0773531 [Tanacetum coccineum]|uniref:Reverse transcriptase domain-containing protein n=1 Tax=Tanacetum coccineum TaxID=301880 RepID=A0ABQ4ZPH2_9ASTR